MTEPPDKALLQKIPLFTRLEDAQLRSLAAQTRRRAFREGDTLFHQGDPGHTLYLVLAGRVRIEKVTPAGRVVHLAHRGPGEHFGEMALLDDQPRMADAVAATACDLLMLDRDAFRRCVLESPPIAMAVMAALASRLRGSAEHLEDQQELDVLGRVSQALLDLAAAQGADESAGPVTLSARMTRQELADQVGATRESVSRAIGSLTRARALRREGRALTILSLKKLRQYCRR